MPLSRLTAAASAAAALLLAGCASTPMQEAATCPNDAVVAAQAQRYQAVALQPPPDAAMTLAGALCGQRKLVAALAASHGPVVGYKAGLTNPVVQKRFNIDSPVLGTLTSKMMLKDGAEVPVSFGARPLMEADLVVEVGSASINQATTPAQAMAGIRAIYPFIELPDLMVADPSKITAPALVFNNVGARLGVLGTPVAVTERNAAALANALPYMTVVTQDGSGKTLASGPGSAILGHPMNAVLWLAKALRAQGMSLKPGDLLSLGAFSQTPVVAGQTLYVRYDGLPGQPEVSVRFK